jgi:hypothetical protein
MNPITIATIAAELGHPPRRPAGYGQVNQRSAYSAFTCIEETPNMSRPMDVRSTSVASTMDSVGPEPKAGLS